MKTGTDAKTQEGERVQNLRSGLIHRARGPKTIVTVFQQEHYSGPTGKYVPPNWLT